MAIRKLKLNADALQVQSFASQALPASRGTAYGYSGQFGPGCASEWPNCIEIRDSGVYGPNCASDPPNCN